MSSFLLAVIDGTGMQADIACGRSSCQLYFWASCLSEGSDATKTQNQIKSGFFLQVIVSQCASIFQLFVSRDQMLLIRRNSFLVYLDILNRLAGLNLKGDCLLPVNVCMKICRPADSCAMLMIVCKYARRKQ